MVNIKLRDGTIVSMHLLRTELANIKANIRHAEEHLAHNPVISKNYLLTALGKTSLSLKYLGSIMRSQR